VLGRVQYTLAYHAASTGRWVGRGIQPHNFTRDLPEPEVVEAIMQAVKNDNPSMVEMFGDVTKMLSWCMRGLIHADADELLGGDYSAIEARGAAWLAGEERRLQAFRDCDADPTLPDIYERTAAKICRIPVAQVTAKQRQAYGKVPELAFTYQGGLGAFHSMAKIYDVHLTDAEADLAKIEWRAEHPAFVDMWRNYQHAALSATLNDKPYTANRCVFRRSGSFLLCKLPSGRVISYPYPKVESGEYGPYLTFKTVPSDIEWSSYAKSLREGTPNYTRIVQDDGNCKQWARIQTYGGMLTENITQAICRDILAEAIVRCEDKGIPVVLHVHDEIVAQADPSRFEQFKGCLIEQPNWAKDFPIAAKCWHAKRYRK
jgi:DNA polymerase